MVRAKFKVTTNHLTGETAQIILEPVIDGSPENESFYKWTPSGKIDLACVNPDATNQFEVGKEYYVDFTPLN